MDLPTYTNIWRIEKRLYKLYDLRLPMPLPIVWIGVFVGVFVPWSLLLWLVGVPVAMPWHVLYLVPPGIVTWLATRPVIEGKRLTELLESQLRYLGEPKAWYRLAPLSEPDTITFSARVWRAYPVRVKASRKSRQPARKRTPATAPRQVRPAVAAAAAAAAHAPLTVTVAESAGRVQIAAEPARTGWGTRVHPSTAPALPSGEPGFPSADSGLPSHESALPSADSGLGARESVLPSGESGLPSREPADHEQVSSGEPADVPSASSVRELRLVRDPVREERPSEPESQDEAAPRRPRQSAGARPIDTEALRRLRKLAASADGTSADTARPERSGEDEAARRQHRKGQPPRLNPALLADAQRSWAPLTPDSRPITLSRPLHDHGPEPTFPTRRDDTSELAPEDSPRDAAPSGESDGAEERPDRSEPETGRGGTRRRGLRVVTTEQEAHPQQAEQPAEEPAPADHQQTGDTTPEGQVAPPEDERAGDGKASRGGSAEDARPATSRGAGRKRAARGAGTEEKVAPSESGRAASEEPERVAGAEVSRGESAEDAGDARSAASPGATRGRDAGAERRGRRAEAARDGAERRQTAWANAGRDVGGERGEVPSDGVSPETAQGERAGEPVGRQVGRADGLIDGGVVVPGPRAGEARVRRVESVVGRDSGGWRRVARVVVGGSGMRGDGSEIDEARARSVFSGSRRIVVLGCTGGAGQSTTALMLGHTLAGYRDDRVVAVDASTGASTLSSRIEPETPETLGSLLAGVSQVSGYLRMRGYTTRTASGLEVVAADGDAEAEQRLADRGLFSDERLGDALALLDRHYKLTVIDPAAALAARVLPYADQLVLVVPASEEASEAVGMTYEWLDGHGCADLRRRAVMVVNGVSRRSMPDVEQAEAVASGRCRAIVRVPWEDDLAPGGAEIVDPGRLRTAGRRAYLALAGVVVAGFAAQKVRPSEEELASDPPGTRIGER